MDEDNISQRTGDRLAIGGRNKVMLRLTREDVRILNGAAGSGQIDLRSCLDEVLRWNEKVIDHMDDTTNKGKILHTAGKCISTGDGQDCRRSTAYRSDEGGTRAQAAGEDIDIAGLLYTADNLAACHVGVGSVLQPGSVEGKATVVSTGRMQAGKDMVLQD